HILLHCSILVFSFFEYHHPIPIKGELIENKNKNYYQITLKRLVRLNKLLS
ncbi:DNA repair/transcription protein met18/mms19,putative, partial [Schistosoma mansoni]|uniref:DNA repair/transcription protein met18/mms19,putative n=1 Tax=Schistosoma mansoni TaxID=6183 RepID=UPI00022C836F